MDKMYYYAIDTLAPLVFRSGKPFGSQASVNDANFPLPSSSAGLIRNQYMQAHQIGLSESGNQNRGKISDADREKLLQIKSCGAFLIRFVINEPNNFTVLLPKPSNVLYLKKNDTGETVLVRLSPTVEDGLTDSDCGTDLPDGLQLVHSYKSKPQKGANFWRLDDYLAWQAGEDLDFTMVCHNGLDSIPVEVRTHVAINNHSLSAEDGKLFQTAGLDMSNALKEHHAGWHSTRLGFLLATPEQLPKATVRFGGEGRLSKFVPIDKNSQALTQLSVPNNLAEDIQQAGRLCMTLLTPAIFANGYLPAWIDQTTLTGTLPDTDIKVKLKAVAVERWQPVSGWDLQQYKPKAMRKAVPAGSVYWFELLNQTQNTIQNIEQLWLKAVSDDQQDCNDGFGIASFHPWSYK